MSDDYVHEILRKCIASICKKSRVSEISNHSLNCLVDIAISKITGIGREYLDIVSEKQTPEQQQKQIISFVLPNNVNRKKELRIFRILLENCKSDKKADWILPSVPFCPSPLFETLPSFSPQVITRKRRREPFSDEPWGDADGDSKLFQTQKPTSFRPKFASAGGKKKTV